VKSVAAGKAIPVELLHQILQRTDGIPLFVEELTKTVLESGLLREFRGHYELTGPLPPLAIPSTLHASLLARLDRLASVKDVAQIGAAIGREFSYGLIAAIAALPDKDLRASLAQLVDAELIFQRGEAAEATYFFKHALVQEAAYASLVRSRRRQLHAQIADALEKAFSDIAESSPEVLAHHFSEAGLIEQAIPYYERAGRLAIQRSAILEAAGHLTKGLDAIKALPDAPARAAQELGMQLLLGPALMSIKGIAAIETVHVYERARALCKQIGQNPPLSVLWGLWYFNNGRAEHRTAQELGEQLLAEAGNNNDATLRLIAHRALGNTMYHVGDLIASRSHLEQGMSLYIPNKHRPLAFQYGQDIAVTCRAWSALGLWLLGYPDQARDRIKEGVALARDMAHLPSLAYALGWAAMLNRFCRDEEATQRYSSEGITLSTENGFGLYLAWCTILSGSSRANREGDEGVAMIRQGISTLRSAGLQGTIPCHLALLAEACGKAGRLEDGLQAIDDALTIVNNKGEHNFEAELYRLKGELQLRRDPVATEEVETCLLKAISIARGQQAKSLELRAALSLATLWQRACKGAKARDLLAPISGWFSEGFDTADLKAAGALLEELRTYPG
jgi:predicted ATPase